MLKKMKKKMEIILDYILLYLMKSILYVKKEEQLILKLEYIAENQLLTKIDGVDALNNIIVIGMTNRRDLLDEAILRP